MDSCMKEHLLSLIVISMVGRLLNLRQESLVHLQTGCFIATTKVDGLASFTLLLFY